MNLWSSATYRSDIEAATRSVDLTALRGKQVLITGASGLIGSAIADTLICCNLTMDAGITVYAAGRSERKLRRRFAHGLNAGLIPVAYDATEAVAFTFGCDYIIHAASNASPELYVKEPVQTMMANITGVYELMKYATGHKTVKFLYVSSSEVYGKLDHGRPLVEEECGHVELLNVRSAYPMGKRAAETMCVSCSQQYQVSVSILRPGHVYGPTAQASDNRVSSAFTRQAAAGQDLVMKSAGTQLRSYCYCIDCATAALAVLTRGENCQAYNVSNSDSIITIRQMAEILAGYAGVRLIMDLPTSAEKAAFNPMDNSSLDSAKLEGLGWRGQFDARKGLSHAIMVLKEVTG